MPYIVFEAYYKHGEWQSCTVETDDEMISIAYNWLVEEGYEPPEKQTVSSMVQALLTCGEEHLGDQKGWAYVKVYKVPKVQKEWG